MGSAPTQGRLWGAAATDWSRLTEPVMIPVYQEVFDVLGVEPVTRRRDAGRPLAALADPTAATGRTTPSAT